MWCSLTRWRRKNWEYGSCLIQWSWVLWHTDVSACEFVNFRLCVKSAGVAVNCSELKFVVRWNGKHTRKQDCRWHNRHRVDWHWLPKLNLVRQTHQTHKWLLLLQKRCISRQRSLLVGWSVNLSFYLTLPFCSHLCSKSVGWVRERVSGL